MTVVLCTWGKALEGGTEEALTLAVKLCQEKNCELNWAVIGPVAEEAEALAGRYGVRHLDVIDCPDNIFLGPDVLVSVLAKYVEKMSPEIILFNQTTEARLIAPRLAGCLEVPVVMNGIAIQSREVGLQVTATAYGGDTHVEYELPNPVNVVSVITTSILAEPDEVTTIPDRREIILASEEVEERFKVIKMAASEGPRLEDADIIVSGGRGLGSAENYQLVRDFADAVGGLAGASRAIVDDGWVDSRQQVGLTGKITRPGLYMAMGISGASQHMAGCSAAKTIVAINTDPDAAIYRYARYGIVGDCVEILPELIKVAKV